MEKIEAGSERHFEKLLNVDCRKEKGWDKIQEYLLSVSQIRKAFERVCTDDMSEIPIDILEKYVHQVSVRKGYQIINIQPFYGKKHDELVFYTSSVKRVEDSVWIGNAYGVTLYETIAKLIVLMNKDMKYPRSKEGEYKYE